MGGLTAAVRRRDWDLAALYLLLSAVRVAARLPHGTAADLLAALEGEMPGGGA